MTDEQYEKATDIRRLKDEANSRADHYQRLIARCNKERRRKLKYHVSGEDFDYDITIDEIENLYKFNCDLINKLNEAFEKV